MKILHQPSDLDAGPRRVCVAIGVFDGVHLGHQQVIRQTIADARQHEARSVVVTFDRHPNVVVAPARAPLMIQTLSQKLARIEQLGAEAALVIHFDEAFSRQSGEQFVEGLVKGFGQLHSVCVGSAFTFGYQRSGNVALLRKLSARWLFTVHALAAVSLDGRMVSSTRIREAIRAGDFDAAGQMLGRAYTLAGPVIRGDELGRKLDFPTANLDVTGLVLPPTGVYAAQAESAGRQSRAAVNIGYRPTLQNPSPQLRVEAHLLDFSGDLYGQSIELTFVRKLRDERRFDSLEALRAQIARDIVAARECF